MGCKDECKLLPEPWEDNTLDTVDIESQRQNFLGKDKFHSYCHVGGGEQKGPKLGQQG